MAGASEPIAIVGMGCRLPGGIESPEAFWTLLAEGREAIQEVPQERWDLERHFHPDPQHPLTQHVRRGGFVQGIDQFDPALFGIAPREAQCMDPQQRLLLEVAWRAMEDGAQPIESLRGQPVGVFIGISSADYSALLWASEADYATPDNEPFILAGNTGCIAANRISYAFDLKGPSFTVDTACSSSLVAVHLACESLWRGESDAALAGGVQALIHPGIQMSFCKAGLLAPDGRCKSFAAAADGYVRSEGAGMVLLKRLSDALRHGDPVQAVIRGTAVNSDGRSHGLSAPSQRAQAHCVRQAYDRAGLDPSACLYVEAHGTGTRQGDPIELRALGSVLGEGRAPERPCRVGSVKTNLGHGETAAGITGLIKAALCVRARQLPPSLHCDTPNPAIDFEGLGLQVQTRLEPFPELDGPAVLGVSSFGFGGTNAHVVLTDPPRFPAAPARQEPPLQLLCLSARSPQALDQLVAAYAALLRAEPDLGLNDLCASTHLGRSAFPHRWLAVAADAQELLAQLEGRLAVAFHGEASPTLIGKPLAAELARLQLGVAGAEGRERLTALAVAVGRGHAIDWRHVHRPYPHQRRELPGHPFLRQRFWWTPAAEARRGVSLWRDHLGLGGLQPSSAPGLRLEPVDLPGPLRHHQLLLHPVQGSDLVDHRLRTTVVFPAAAYLALALELQHQRGVVPALKDLQISAPLRLGAEPTPLQAVEEGHTLRFHARPSADGEWIQHAAVELARPQGASPPGAMPSAQNSSLDPDGFYAALAAIGFTYGPRYRPIRQLQAGSAEAWAVLERPPGAPDRCLLDGCIQVVAAAVDADLALGQVFLPVAVEAAVMEQWPLPDSLTCRAVLDPSSVATSTLVADLWLSSGGQPVGWICGLRLRRLTRPALELMLPADGAAADPPGPGCYVSTWHSVESAPRSAEAGAAALPLRDGPLRDWIEQQGWLLDPLPEGSAPPAVAGPLVVWPRTAQRDPVAAVEGLLALIQPLRRPLWLVLEGQGPVAGALAGFARTAVLERPELQLTTLQLPAAREEQPLASHWQALVAAAEQHAVLRWHNGAIERPRLEPLPASRFRITGDGSGRLEALHPEPMAPSAPLAGELELAVEATGLNFRDVLNALGLLEAHAAQLGLADARRLPFGGECVGRVVAVGPGGDPSLLGQRMIAALTVGSLASHVVARAELCVPLPPELSPAEGASLSTAFLTAIYGLEQLARLQPGETVLIHAAAGGVGQAALQVARRAGARILATASAAKQQGLLEQGVEAVFDSRTLAFADQVLAHTAGRGVDVVLNSLKGAWVDAGFRALAQGGRFVELGKIEVWAAEQAAERRPDARYLPFDLLEVAAAQPRLVAGLLRHLMADLKAGVLERIPLQVLPLERCGEAFRLMAQGRHVGKVVISQPERPAPLRIRPDATYLVSGALGGIGLQLLPWLAARGARSLLLVGRRAETPDRHGQAVLAALEARGVTCIRLACDLGRSAAPAQLSEALRALPPERPLRGIVHAAGVLRDGLLDTLSAAQLEAVIAPKLGGWIQLEQACVAAAPSGLEFVVGFSSVAALLGSPGQAAYGAANGAMEGCCRETAEDSPVRLAIQWGPWAGAGMAEGWERRFSGLGLGLLEPCAALEALGGLLERGRGGVVAVLQNDWGRLAAQAPPRQQHWFAALVEAAEAGERPTLEQARLQLLQRLEGLTPQERLLALTEELRGRLARVMASETGAPVSIDPAVSLFQLGLDSLMAVEFAASVQMELGLGLDLDALGDDPSLLALAERALGTLFPGAEAEPAAGLDLAAEARLPADWTLPMAAPARSPGEAVLLTGASGFLGAYLLAGQLRRWPDLRLRCLVRAPSADAGLERLRRNLQRYQLWDPAWLSRLEVVPGDLSQPAFGLDRDAFAGLAKGLGGILHNGAQLSQMATYAQLAPANVGGTREVLRLAALGEPLRLELISSVAVFEAAAYRHQPIEETTDIAEWRGIHVGYSQTKWVSERLVLAAGRAGLPVAVYRPPLIGGHARTGHWHDGDLLQRLLQGCLALGMAPDLPWELDLVPVDYVADAVTALAWSEAACGRCFHLQHPEPVMLADLLGRLIQRGAPLELVPMAQWLAAIEADGSNPLHPIRAFFQQRWGPEQLTYPELNQLGLRARPRASATTAALAPLGVRCPGFDALVAPWARTLLAPVSAA